MGSKKDGISWITAVLGLALAILAISWRGGERFSRLEAVAAEFVSHRDSELGRDSTMAQRLARVETMVEMMLKSEGIVPPPREYGGD